MKKDFYQPRLLCKPGNIIGKQNLRSTNHNDPAFFGSDGFQLPHFLPVSGNPKIGGRSYPIINHPDFKAGVIAVARLQQGAASIILIIGGGH
jgi:hypothetical protein